jgi:hypothetical protein
VVFGLKKFKEKSSDLLIMNQVLITTPHLVLIHEDVFYSLCVWAFFLILTLCGVQFEISLTLLHNMFHKTNVVHKPHFQ